MKKNKEKKNKDQNQKTTRTKKEKLNIAMTVAMFTGVIGSLATMPIVSTFFSSKQPKKNASISDHLDDTKISEIKKKDNKKKTLIKLSKEIEATKLFDINKKIAYNHNHAKFKDGSNSIVKSKAEFTFYNTGYKLKGFFNDKDSIQSKEISAKDSSKIEILNFDLVDKLSKFNKEAKSKTLPNLEFKDFIKEISNLKLSFTYSFKNEADKKWYFYDTNNKLFGIEINNYFKQLKEYVEKNITADKKISREESKIIIKAIKNKNSNNLIDKFVIEIAFSYEA
ncbi:hypothetical protein [Metamycoplasma auris]|uniref:Uncharacterized protein n=1 Tax=Metamycoplasma auris TaxID=51363 RepID=A0A2W7GV14_9BACT|nr:hypothetical protein [Metamycoplasma auris]PZW01533.1 hypothetical protein BCF89_10153 [Metamycoplasma auris]